MRLCYDAPHYLVRKCIPSKLVPSLGTLCDQHKNRMLIVSDKNVYCVLQNGLESHLWLLLLLLSANTDFLFAGFVKCINTSSAYEALATFTKHRS